MGVDIASEDRVSNVCDVVYTVYNVCCVVPRRNVCVCDLVGVIYGTGYHVTSKYERTPPNKREVWVDVFLMSVMILPPAPNTYSMRVVGVPQSRGTVQIVSTLSCLSRGPGPHFFWGETSHAIPQYGWWSASSLRQTLSPIQDQKQH